MKKYKTWIAVTLLVVVGSLLLAWLSPTKKAVVATAASPGFAVVELFTSEGCSSCPPADKVVAAIQKEYGDQQVYVLAYHVDYWDRLGWKDAFDDAAYTSRQYTYAEWLKLESVYTPQIVVNGRTEFVGSNETALRSAIKNNLSHAGAATLSITSTPVKDGSLMIEYNIDKAEASYKLLLALVQRNAVSKVLRGENKGKDLSHVQIVQQLQTVDLKKNNKGNVAMIIPAKLKPEELEVIAFIQDSKTGLISAAAKTSVH